MRPVWFAGGVGGSLGVVAVVMGAGVAGTDVEVGMGEGVGVTKEVGTIWQVGHIASVRPVWLPGNLGAPPTPVSWHSRHTVRPMWFAGGVGGSLGVVAVVMGAGVAGTAIGVAVGVTPGEWADATAGTWHKSHISLVLPVWFAGTLGAPAISASWHSRHCPSRPSRE